MSETDRTADFLAKNLKVSRQDQSDPFKPRELHLSEMPDDEGREHGGQVDSR